MNKELYILYLEAIDNLIKKLDVYNFKKILLSRKNKKPETLLEFIKIKDNQVQIRIYLERLLYSLANSVQIETMTLEKHIYELMRMAIYGDELSTTKNLSTEDCELFFDLILYSFLYDIYQGLDNNQPEFSKIYFAQRSFEEHIVQTEDLLNDSEKMFYRGQTIECSMSPSMLRNLNKNISINCDTYEYIIRERGDKYDAHFRSGGIYEKMAFFQHSTNYSPMLDFTSKKIVAGSFALSNSNDINHFENNDSIIFGIQKIGDNEINNVIDKVELANRFFENDFYIDVIDSESITLFKTYSLMSCKKDKTTGKITKKRKNITFTTFSDLYKYLTPTFKFIDVKTNDRMKYQEGLFLVFYGCVSLRGRIFYEFNPYFNLYRFVIYKNNKRDILDGIYKNYREYDLKHLMDPYTFLSE